MKVKFENRKYKVSFCDKVYIESQKLLLFLKRQKRRFVKIFSKDSLFLYFVISVFWVLFATATYYLGQDIKGTTESPYTIADVFWDLKNSYFTSVILAFAINSMNRIKEYKRLIRAQHYLYVDAMSDFDNLFKQYVGEEIQHYMPMYCEKTLETTINYVSQKVSIKIDDNEQLLVFDGILKRLDELERCCKNQQLVITNDELLLCCIDDARKALNEAIIHNKYKQIEELEKIARKLYWILVYIRRPWRIDVQIKIKILSILDSYPNSEIKDNFYYNMLLYGHSFEDKTCNKNDTI